MTNPVDVVKTRLQIQGELGRGGAEPKFGMLSGTARLVQTEGIRALYKGLLPSLLREASYSTIRMGAYESFKHRLFPDHVGELPVFKKFIAAGLSGALGAAIANPTDLASWVSLRVLVMASGLFPQQIRRFHLAAVWRQQHGRFDYCSW